MKKLATFILILLLTSCEIQEKRIEHRKCVVTKVTEKRHSEMNFPTDVHYVFETDCGATSAANNPIYAVGDTVDVQIISFK